MMIDTGPTGGSVGPWLRWTSEGSARKRLEPESWALRDKDASGVTVEKNVPAFTSGCVMDLDSLKLGWEREGAGAGSAPERRWNPSVSQSMPRPDDSKKAAGGFAWSQALSVRVAIGGGNTATWEQGGFGAYEAFRRLAAEINAGNPHNGTLPLVKQTGVEQRRLPNGSTAIPILTVDRWVPRPDCLKEGAAAGIATEPASIQQQAQQAAAQVAAAVAQPATAGDDDLEF